MKTRSLIRSFIIYTLLSLISILFLVPIVLLFSSSISDNARILQEGYSLIPRGLDFSAYRYLVTKGDAIFHAMGISVLVTVVGTALSLSVTALFAYPLSRKQLPGRRVFTFLLLFTLLFNGGLVPTYLIYTQLLHIKDSFFALIVPNLLFSGYNVIIMRTYFTANIPDSLIEAAYLDGAGEFRIFRDIVFRMSLPIMATVGILQAMVYWNDWFNSLVYIQDSSLMSMQAVLNQMIHNVNFLASLGSVMSGTMGLSSIIPGTTVRMAMAFLGILPFILIYPVTQRFFVRGVSIGSVKE